MLTLVCSLILDAGLIKATQNDILTHQSHHPEPTLAPIPLQSLALLASPTNPKSAVWNSRPERTARILLEISASSQLGQAAALQRTSTARARVRRTVRLPTICTHLALSRRFARCTTPQHHFRYPPNLTTYHMEKP